MIDEGEDPWGGGLPGGPLAGLIGPKMASELYPQESILVILGPLGPPGGHPKGPHPHLSFSTTSLHNISVI